MNIKKYNTGKHAEDNVVKLLGDDGVKIIDLKKYENFSTINLKKIKKEMGSSSWAVRIIYNERFGEC